MYTSICILVPSSHAFFELSMVLSRYVPQSRRVTSPWRWSAQCSCLLTVAYVVDSLVIVALITVVVLSKYVGCCTSRDLLLRVSQLVKQSFCVPVQSVERHTTNNDRQQTDKMQNIIILYSYFVLRTHFSSTNSSIHRPKAQHTTKRTK